MTAGDRQPGENARPTITPATEREADVLDVLAEAVGRVHAAFHATSMYDDARGLQPPMSPTTGN